MTTDEMTQAADYLESVRQLRRAYEAVYAALPWLDMAVWDDDPPAFPEYARAYDLPAIKAADAQPGMVGALPELRAEGYQLLRYQPELSGTLPALHPLLAQMAREKMPLVLLHTDVEFDEMARLSGQYPQLPLIVESGPVKILYFLAHLEELMGRHENVYLCTYNFCNWLGHERLCAKGFGKRMLFGSHRPRYNPHAAMGPIAMGRLTWEQKCDLAGNNLRRLLGMPVIQAPEVEFVAPLAFIVDAHTHSGPPGRFPVPDEAVSFTVHDWLEFMDWCAIERINICAYESLMDAQISPEQYSRSLRAAAGGRILYYAVFFPNRGPEHLARIQAYLDDPECAGIKIHPSWHEVEGDDEAYGALYELAERRGATILTHSWDVSPTNPVQYVSHPDRFRPHLAAHPQVKFVLAHAGGRPGSAEAVVRLCAQFPQVNVDIAGDYYDNGLIEFLVDKIGESRILFGSDMNWIDPRANLAPVLAADLSDEVVLEILRTNALSTYR